MVAYVRHRWHRVLHMVVHTVVHIVAHTTHVRLRLHLHLTTNHRDMHGQALHGHTWYSIVT